MEYTDPVEAPDVLTPETEAMLAEMLTGVWEGFDDVSSEDETIPAEELH